MTRLYSYITGYVLSLALTLAPVLLLWMREAGGRGFPGQEALCAVFVGAALLQLVVQLYFFLHVGGAGSPGALPAMLSFALFAVAVLVGGTLWIMGNLSYLHGHGAAPAPAGVPFIDGSITPQAEND